jgi:two-component system response regulator HydG
VTPPDAKTSTASAAKADAKPRYRLIALDDEPDILSALRRVLGSRGFDLVPFTDPFEALGEIRQDAEAVDVVMLDVQMPELSGLEVLARVKEIAPELPVVMLTADARAETAVAALKGGAFTYLTKPLDDPDEIALTLTRAADHAQLHRRARRLERRLEAAEGFEKLVGSSSPMREVFATIEKLARTDVGVLIRGESGTGKELVARAIHDRSTRGARPFVALNCAAMPEALVESELFGHTRGAFTGAIGARPGAFERANSGTLFLDEIGDIPLPVQLRLLRVLQEREVRPVGSDVPKPVDVRVIAATLVDLDAAVERKVFRADLYYRLNVVALSLPPLRDRLDDVPLLCAHFLKKHATRQGRTVPRFSVEAIDVLGSYAWPGNVRELENAIQRALALTPDDEIGMTALPQAALAGAKTQVPAVEDAAAGAAAAEDLAWADPLAFNDARKLAQQRFERAYLIRLLKRTRGNISDAARRAGLDRSNFRRILSRNGIHATDHR